MASHTTYTCDFCGHDLSTGESAADALGVRVVRANHSPRIERVGDCCKRCEMILTSAMRDALHRCREAAP